MEARNDTAGAFTLVEMLIVIAVIAVLAAMLMVGIQSARKGIKENATRVEVKNLELAMTNYYSTWGEYPPDRDTSLNLDDSSEALVYFLGSTFRVSPGSGEVAATRNADPSFNFPADRLRDPDSDGRDSFIDLLGEARTVPYFRFDNNEPSTDDETNWGNLSATNSNYTNVNTNGVDIWSAGWDGEDPVSGGYHWTRSNIETLDKDDLGNW